ncbi:hypothetical protein [Sporomusa acidovorans]|uniref:hypothetical protein n=1 Tax=Sporomusa acidovorans TaxID=112900 RepID=UPI0011606AA4|nr:hypothetical protein [Sporomusa acidovorans]
MDLLESCDDSDGFVGGAIEENLGFIKEAITGFTANNRVGCNPVCYLGWPPDVLLLRPTTNYSQVYLFTV